MRDRPASRVPDYKRHANLVAARNLQGQKYYLVYNT